MLHLKIFFLIPFILSLFENGSKTFTTAKIIKIRKMDEELNPIFSYRENVINNTRDQDVKNIFERDVAEGINTIYDRIKADAEYKTRSKKVTGYIELMAEDGSFTDIQYDTDGNALRKHGVRLGGMVYAELKSMGQLSERTRKTFEFLTKDEVSVATTNWWSHLIGVPSKLWPAIFLASPHLDPTLVENIMNKFFTYTQSGPVWNMAQKTGRNAGGNFAPRAYLSIIEALIRGNYEEFHKELTLSMHREVVLRQPWDGNGVRPDGCLHQHNLMVNQNTGKRIFNQIYNNNYGKEFLKYAAILIELVDGTYFDFGKEIEDGVLDSFFDCEQWLYRYKIVEPTSTGRFIDSGKIVTKWGGSDAVQKPLQTFKRMRLREQNVAAALHRYNKVTPDKQYALEGNRYFFSSDLTAHQRRNFMATLRIMSRRTMRPETVSTQNNKGYFEGDGFLNVLVTGKEFGETYKEVFQVYDFARLPGVTCLYTEDIPFSQSTSQYHYLHAFNDVDFAGGVSNGFIGVTGMVYNRPTVDLKALKSWFFFDDLIVCLGSGISLPKADVNQVSTTLTQIVYEGTYKIGGDSWSEAKNLAKEFTTYDVGQVRWLHHNSTGYVLLDGNLNVKVEQKKIKNEPISLFSAWTDHSTFPKDASYSYVILPAWSSTDTENFVQNPKIQVVSQSKQLHSVCYSSKALGAVLYEEGCVSLNSCLNNSPIQKLCLDKPGMLLITDISGSTSTDMCTNKISFVDAKYQKQSKIAIKDNFLNTIDKSKYLNTKFSNYINKYLKENKNIRNNLIVNKELKQEEPIIQITLSDPTQKLDTFKLQIVGQSSYTKTVNVDLPKEPKRGKSHIMCI